MAFWKEFKTFAMKGNVMDMAVGVIIGGAFGKIVTSLVNDILMPPIGALLGNVNFTDLKLDISKVRDVTSQATSFVTDGVGKLANGEAPAEVVEQALEPIYWNYGAFIQQCFDFFILAFCVFMMVKVMNKISLKRKAEEDAAAAAAAAAPAPEPQPSKEELLLTEIRDLLKEQNNK
ncbi:MAG: large conductance mechanosensitive channel protein MscL [Tidjanibacter sp.]|nr:large conductance mechanosensitive channel protein MscL [Tidjanibacter sp.]